MNISQGLSGEGANPGRKQLLELAAEFSIYKPEKIITEVQSSLALWPTVATECGVSDTSITRIQSKLIELRD